MIAPQTRLIFWAGVVSISMAALAAMGSAPSVLLVPLGGVFLLVLLGDAVWARSVLDGISAGFPDVVRLTKDREGELVLVIDSTQAATRRLRLGVAFPPEIVSPHNYVVATLPEGSERSQVSWPCTGMRRGNYALDKIYIETDSPMGFWAVRKASASTTEIRVYPNILSEQKNLAALFLNRGMVGVHAQRQVGKGRDFEKLRDYIPGDSYEDIHWKATAKRGRPVTKVFQIERTQEVYVVIDASRLSARTVYSDETTPTGNAPATQLERFITSAMVLGLVAQKQGDLFGLLAFDDQVRTFVRARSGKAHYNACRDALYTAQPKMVNPDFGELCSFIRLRLRRRALLVFLTNLDDPVLAEGFVHNLDLVARHHLVLVNMLNLPGVAPLFSNPDVESTDDLYQRLGGHIQWQKLRELGKVLKRRGVTMTVLDNESMCPQLVSQYINVKRRQLL